MKKFLFLVLAIMLVLPMVVSAAFSDVAEDHWAAGFINELTEQKVINGYTDGTFRPNGTLTKGEFMKLIMTASLPELDFSIAPKDFNHWAAGYVKVAENYSVLDVGEITAENIDLPINRIDVIRILSLADINIRNNMQKFNSMLPFIDTDDLDSKEMILLGHAVEKGIIGGYPDGTFKPTNNLTRAEVSKILSIYMQTTDNQ